MNEIDSLKALRLQEELQHFDAERVESWSRIVLDELVRWADQNIFSAQRGALTIDFPLGAPNAGVNYISSEPLCPKIIIRQSMLIEIYRDAFTFPLTCRRIVSESTTVEQMHASSTFQGLPYLFEEALPPLDPRFVHDALNFVCDGMVTAAIEGQDNLLEPSDLRCRFIMFELMLVWTFFHELGHVVQRHINLKKGVQGTGETTEAYLENAEPDVIVELADPDSALAAETNLRAQGRELLADAESLDLTVKYLARTNRLEFPVVYLLMCSISCMFQRFYKTYDEDLRITTFDHPHPAVREQVSQGFLIKLLCDTLVTTDQAPDMESAAIALTYLSVRASVFAGLFRSHRIERRDDPSTMPSYMQLQTEVHASDLRTWLKALIPSVEHQMPEILANHLLSGNRLEDWLLVLQRLSNDHLTLDVK